MRDITPPTVDDRGEESHPSWGLIGASRGTTGPPGAALFDSDILHQHTIRLRIQGARRQRKLGRDWLHGARLPYIEVEMSEAQWASFVSTMNVGDGVPCTVRYLNGKEIPEAPHSPRLKESMEEVRTAAKKALAKVSGAFADYKEKKNAANLRALEVAVSNLPADLAFTADSLTEHSEAVVQKARADIEAFVLHKAEQLGLDPADLAHPLELDAGDGPDA